MMKAAKFLKKKLILSAAVILVISIFTDIICGLLLGSIPFWLPYIKIALLIACLIFFKLSNELSGLWRISAIGTVYTVMDLIVKWVSGSAFWKSAFSSDSFIDTVGNSMLLKFITVIPIAASFFFLFKSSEEFYLCRGDLRTKAHKIVWLGIPEGKIGWGKLAVISGVLITLGTGLLGMATALGFQFKNAEQLLRYIPVILLFAMCNSFSEGLIYRCGILGALKEIVPQGYAVLMSAVFFGIAHYYGVPGGPLGAVMSGLLGWYMARSMAETKGMVSAWIIHFMQDTVIFSMMVMMK